VGGLAAIGVTGTVLAIAFHLLARARAAIASNGDRRTNVHPIVAIGIPHPHGQVNGYLTPAANRVQLGGGEPHGMTPQISSGGGAAELLAQTPATREDDNAFTSLHDVMEVHKADDTDLRDFEKFEQ
jgi:hypothetical protein